MPIVICELRIKNSYKDDHVIVSHWIDVSKQSLISYSQKLFEEIISRNINARIKYEEESDDCFGGRLFFTVTIVIGRY